MQMPSLLQLIGCGCDSGNCKNFKREGVALSLFKDFMRRERFYWHDPYEYLHRVTKVTGYENIKCLVTLTNLEDLGCPYTPP